MRRDVASTELDTPFSNTVCASQFSLDNHLQHLQTSPPEESAKRMTGSPASARVVMDVPAPTEAHVLPSPSSSYVELFAQIVTLQAKGDHYGLIQAAECADLAVCLPSYSRVYCDSLTFPSLAQGDERYSSYTTSHYHSPRALLSDS